MRLSVFLVACALMLSACSTVTIRPKGGPKLAGNPTYETSKPFYLFGLIGVENVNLTKACNGKTPVQWQSQDTFLDSFLGVITIGIYTPRSVRIWCDGGQS